MVLTVKSSRPRYGYRRRIGRTRPKLKKQVINKDNAIMYLTKQVNSIKKKVDFDARTTYLANYSNQGVVGPYNQLNLSLINGTTLLYGRDLDDMEQNRCVWQTCSFNGFISMGNEGNDIGYTMFIVSLRSNIPDDLFDASTGTIGPLTANLHYYSSAGKTFLNPEIFNVHKVKRFLTTNYGRVTGDSSANTMPSHIPFDITFKPNKKIVSPSNWYNLVCPSDPAKNYFLLLFSDNSSVDLESPTLEVAVQNIYRTT